MTTPTPLRMGWLGLGSMGLAMATNLQKHLTRNQFPPLRYWNRTAARGEPLQALGGVVCADVAEMVAECDVIWISLSDDAAVQHIIDTLAQHPLTGKTIVNTTTITPALAASLSTSLSPLGATYLSAPVFGATPLAISGTLLIALAGAPHAIATLTPFLTGVLARAVIPVGPDPAQALALKTAGNYLTAGLMLLLSEAHVLAARAGLPENTLEELVAHNFGDYALGVSQRLTGGAYCPAPGEPPRSGLELGIKDVGIGVGMAEGGVLRMGEAYLEAAGEAKAWGDQRGRRLDSSSVYGVVRQRAGLDFEAEIVKARDEKGEEKDD